jgi:hypothetical protein
MGANLDPVPDLDTHERRDRVAGVESNVTPYRNGGGRPDVNLDRCHGSPKGAVIPDGQDAMIGNLESARDPDTDAELGVAQVEGRPCSINEDLTRGAQPL